MENKPEQQGLQFKKMGAEWYITYNGKAHFIEELCEILSITGEALRYIVGEHVPNTQYDICFCEEADMHYITATTLEAAAQILLAIRKISGQIFEFELDCTWMMAGAASILAENISDALNNFSMHDGNYVKRSLEADEYADVIVRCKMCMHEKQVQGNVQKAWCPICGYVMEYDRFAIEKAS